MKEKEFIASYPVYYISDVKWGEMDAMQHVNNTVYFRYFESSRMVYWEQMEKAKADDVDAKHIGPILASTSCRFRRPLFYPDRILVGSKLIDVGIDRFTVEHAIWSEREEKIVADGEAVIVSYHYGLKKKVDLPKAWRDFLNPPS